MTNSVWTHFSTLSDRDGNFTTFTTTHNKEQVDGDDWDFWILVGMPPIKRCIGREQRGVFMFPQIRERQFLLSCPAN